MSSDEEERLLDKPSRSPLKNVLAATGRVVERYQSLIGTIVGFAAVVITLSFQGFEARRVERERDERAGLNTALLLIQDYNSRIGIISRDYFPQANGELPREQKTFAKGTCLDLLDQLKGGLGKPSPFPFSGSGDLSVIPVLVITSYNDGMQTLERLEKLIDAGNRYRCADEDFAFSEELLDEIIRLELIRNSFNEMEPLATLNRKIREEYRRLSESLK